jgi:hypothetical protein
MGFVVAVGLNVDLVASDKEASRVVNLVVEVE